MKYISSIFLSLFLLGCHGTSYNYFDGTFEEAKAAAGSKLIFIKFYTNTWASCIRLDVETLRNPEVQAISNEHLISLKYNAKDEIGNKLYKQYNCQFVPHLLFLDAQGNEVDRIIGFIPPTEYLLKLNDIINKRNTLDDYLSKYEKGDQNAEIIAAIATKYEDRKDKNNAAKFYKILIEKYHDPNSNLYKNGKFFLASYAFEKGNDNALRNYIKGNPNSDFLYDAYRKMTHFYANNNNQKKEIQVYEEMLIAFPNDPNALNSYAWRMAEIDTNLEDALSKVKKAVELSSNNRKQQAGIIDTEAEVLWKLKRYDEAIIAIEKAISIDPENKYFLDQKQKFKESKSNDQSV